MTFYAVRYIAVRGIEHEEMPEHATTALLHELPQRHDQVWLGEQRYQVGLREIDQQNAVVRIFVHPIGARRAECQN
jgi:hypothetical protein